MVKNNVNVQDHFLNMVRKDKLVVVIILNDETELEGVVRSFDNFCIMLDAEKPFLIYKHAISTIYVK